METQTKPVLERMVKEGHKPVIEEGVPVVFGGLHIYGRGTQRVMYNPEKDAVFSRYDMKDKQ